MPNISKLVENELCFFPEKGYGHYPVPKDRPYDEKYFEKYEKMAETEMGKLLTQSRIDFVRRYFSADVVDIGIGSGQFVASLEGTKGYDVNPTGIKWLQDQRKFFDIYTEKANAITMWDVLEHVDDPEKLIAQAKKFVFVSIPIFDNAEHILKSRHFRKDEHIHYWTHDGLITWFKENGFILREYNKIESDLGREGINTYAFEREI